MTERFRLSAKLAPLTSEEARPAVHRILLVVLCLAMYLPGMFRGLINSDETRYAEIIREMVESGDWIVPHLNYVPYFMKPPLLYWMSAGLVELLGFHPFILRLWPLLAAILTVLATYELGGALGSRRSGLIGGAILATTAEYAIMAAAFLTDMVFTAFLVGAWLCFWRYYQRCRASEVRGVGWLILFWILASLACLTKGPLGPVFLLFTIGVFLLVRGEWRFAFRMGPIMGLIILAAVNGPWMWAIYQRDPRYLDFFYVRVSGAGLKNAVLMHEEPFYYYFGAMLLGLMPWSLPTAGAIYLAVRDFIRQGRRDASSGFVFVLAMFLGGFVLLSIPAAKLPTYSLPLFPVAALIAAHYITTMGRESRWARWLLPVQTGIMAVLLVLDAFLDQSARLAAAHATSAFWIAVGVGLAAMVAGVVASLVSFRGRFILGLTILGVTAALAYPCAMVLAPRVVPFRTTEGLCRQFEKDLATADLVVAFDSGDFSLPLTLQRRVALAGNAGELGMGLFVQSNPGDAPVPDDPFHLRGRDIDSPYLLETRDLWRHWVSNRRVFLFATGKHLEELRETPLPNLHVLGANGHTTLLTNHPPGGEPDSVPPPEKRTTKMLPPPGRGR